MRCHMRCHMRCLRDHISIENFAKKIMQFLHITDASFSILTNDKSPTKSLWNGPNLYTVFMNRLRHKIAKVIKWTQITDLQNAHSLRYLYLQRQQIPIWLKRNYQNSKSPLLFLVSPTSFGANKKCQSVS